MDAWMYGCMDFRCRRHVIYPSWREGWTKVDAERRTTTERDGRWREKRNEWSLKITTPSVCPLVRLSFHKSVIHPSVLPSIHLPIHTFSTNSPYHLSIKASSIHSSILPFIHLSTSHLSSVIHPSIPSTVTHPSFGHPSLHHSIPPSIPQSSDHSPTPPSFRPALLVSLPACCLVRSCCVIHWFHLLLRGEASRNTSTLSESSTCNLV